MPTIKFSHEYVKMHGQTKKAQLLAMRIIYNQDLNHDLLEYDTRTTTGQYYPIDPTKQYIQLFLMGEKFIPYMTLRTFSQKKWDYYKSNLDNVFDIEFVKSEVKLLDKLTVGGQTTL